MVSKARSNIPDNLQIKFQVAFCRAIFQDIALWFFLDSENTFQ